jgi:hypothetical protein
VTLVGLEFLGTSGDTISFGGTASGSQIYMVDCGVSASGAFANDAVEVNATLGGPTPGIIADNSVFRVASGATGVAVNMQSGTFQGRGNTINALNNGSISLNLGANGRAWNRDTDFNGRVVVGNTAASPSTVPAVFEARHSQSRTNNTTNLVDNTAGRILITDSILGAINPLEAFAGDAFTNDTNGAVWYGGLNFAAGNSLTIPSGSTNIGTAGPAGPQGPQGAQGIQGPQGFAGATGATGPIGPLGPTGPAGAVGPTGATGATGPIGLTGPQGTPGATGPQGPAGTAGPDLAASVTASGLSLLSGNNVVQFNATDFNYGGVFNGSFPTQLSATSPGRYQVNASVRFENIDNFGSLRRVALRKNGVTQIAETRISAVGTNKTPTVSALVDMQAGDYIEVIAHHDAGSTAGSSSARADMHLVTTGQQGPQGAQGIQGPQGVAGSTGAPGIQGPQGEAGPQGPQGLAGAIGATGAMGATGPQGPQGAQGAQGIQGLQGDVGPQGAAGQNNVNWQGTWSAATTYAVNDAVYYLGSSYRSLVASNVNFQPDISSSQWALFAAGGGSGNATLTAGGLLANTVNSTVGYTFGNTNNGNGTGVNTRSNGLWGRIGSGVSGNLPVGGSVPTGVGLTNANFAIGTLGTATGNSVGVVGSVGSGGAVGVWGHNDNNGGTNWNVGVIGTSAGTNADATGVFGQANVGVRGRSLSSTGFGVRGENTNTTGGVGVYGSTASASGRGVISFGSFFLDNRNSPTVNGDAINIFGRNSRVASVNADLEWFAYGFTNISDRNKKENFAEVNTRDVLEKVAGLPITTWNFKESDPNVRRMGPMAQDFHAAFGLNGKDDKTISLVDGQGVALAAIQGLNAKLGDELKQRDLVIEAQKAKLAEMESRVARLEDIATQSGFSLKQGANLGIGLGALVGLPLIGIALLRRRK